MSKPVKDMELEGLDSHPNLFVLSDFEPPLVLGAFIKGGNGPIYNRNEIGLHY